MTKLQEELLMACQALGIDIELDFIVSLKGGKKIQTAARIPSLGGKEGMLIVKSFDEFNQICNNFPVEKYGVSTLDEPRQEFNLDAIKEMFIDWGWSGDGANVQNEKGDMHV